MKRGPLSPLTRYYHHKGDLRFRVRISVAEISLHAYYNTIITNCAIIL